MYSILSLIFFVTLPLGYETYFGSKQRFSQVVAFGDSLSDTGNGYKLTNKKWPIVPPYYRGRYSNGPNWFDRLDADEKSNYAVGGATTDSNFIQGYTFLNTVSVPGVRQQIAAYLKHTSKIKIALTQPLYIIWAGGNDFVFNNTVTPDRIINSLMNAVQDLLAVGAKNFLIFNQGPTQSVPYFSRLKKTALFTALTLQANTALQTSLAALQKKNKKASIHMFDTNTYITKVIANELTTKFTNTVDKCWDAINSTYVAIYCKDPTQYVFIDSFHFTSPVQQLIADAVQPFLSKKFKDNALGSYIRSF